ncbi:HesB/IscA family protein [Ferruginibacter yonginensis]|uniref:HesB/IscA family protein n=1 Tax=Ferruginibacter yonginensis TaxID=1310416 RepID=A0ABV8QN62_9BACT
MEPIIKNPINFTASAINEIKRLMTEPTFDHTQLLRVGVKGGGCSGMTYVLEFDQRKDNDAIYEIDDVRFIIDNAHSMYLFGMEVDWQGGLNSRGFTFNNPNASSTCGCGTSFAV